MRILIAGVGNLFFGDDAFGCEVARALRGTDLPKEVDVRDFGIRSYDLACALQEGYGVVILLDAIQRGNPVGTLSLIEPRLSPDAARNNRGGNLHSVDLIWALENTGIGLNGKSQPPERPYVLLLGCEPAVLEVEEIGLSNPVRASVPAAVTWVRSLVQTFLSSRSDAVPPGGLTEATYRQS